VSSGLVARLKAPLQQRADFAEVLSGAWSSLTPGQLKQRPVYLGSDGPTELGEIFELKGEPSGRIRFVGDLEMVDRLGAGMTEGEVIVEGSLGNEAGLALAGGAIVVEGDVGPRAGAAPPGFKRGMTGGELIVHGSAGPGAGAAMRRGLLVIGNKAGEQTGLGMIAGTVVVFGAAGADSGLWSKRGTVIAFGDIAIPATYAYACTYQPVHLRLLLTRLSERYKLPVRPRHLKGFYRRYSGDLAELGKGEILTWTAKQ
jgi:formylmethanofuran dehydrogenase subunit C